MLPARDRYCAHTVLFVAFAPRQVGMDLLNLLAVFLRGLYVAPPELYLEYAVVRCVVVASQNMRDFPLFEVCVDKAGFRIVFQLYDFFELGFTHACSLSQGRV